MLQLIRDQKTEKILTEPTAVKPHRDGHAILMTLKHDKPWYELPAKGRFLSHDWHLRLKRALDIGICLALMPIILPLLALCCLAIRMDSPGPIFFFQNRTGKGGKPFKVFKLRTMVKNASELRDKLMYLNELNPPDFKISNDPRVTRVGKVLRKLSLDELPQVFNVLMGSMALVGPRPSSYNAHTYDLWHTVRFELKPGMTGLAQVCGRSELMLDEKLRYDIAYLRNMSFWLDLRILLRTIPVVLAGEGVK